MVEALLLRWWQRWLLTVEMNEWKRSVDRKLLIPSFGLSDSLDGPRADCPSGAAGENKVVDRVCQ
jgi:hypothetical protein